MKIDEKFYNPEYFENRELSWLKFDLRVLNEARDKSIPLLERLKFISITSSNLDEFFMVRVASLKDQVHADYKKKDIAGLTAERQLELIAQSASELVGMQYSAYNRSILPALSDEGIILHEDYSELDERQREFVKKYFDEQIYPVLTPMAVDASRPFPLIQNKTINIAALIRQNKVDVKAKNAEKNKPLFATVQVPSVLPRLVAIPSASGKEEFVFLEAIIEDNLDKLYLNCDILTSCAYRVMRNADLSIDEEEAEDLLQEIEKQLRRRQWGEVIRLEVGKKCDDRILDFLMGEHKIAVADVYKVDGPLDLTCLMKLYGIDGYDRLRQPKYIPARHPALDVSKNIFEQIAKGDVFLHHPYQSFDPVVEFIKQAATDPMVLAIKQTLYRVSGNSPIIAALARAAEQGKQVSVLVELKARFDEEHNIEWARRLEKAGCHVIYGLVGLKTHSKISLVVRREESGIVRYVHLGTGNYNDSTAKLYTDCGILTCRESIGEDATAFFNMLSGYSEPANWNSLIVAPIWLRRTFLALIEREAKNAKHGRKASITAKMNSLCDPEIIAALYAASCAGVKINLLVRGICCLKAGIRGVSENIHVRSIVGNFLEHSRIFCFENDGDKEYYMGSADWMPRNLDRRVEILFPVYDERIKSELAQILELEFEDNVKAHILGADGTYSKQDKRGKTLINSQEIFCELAKAAAREDKLAAKKGTFVPATAPEVASQKEVPNE